MQLAPNDAEALGALGVYFYQRSADLERARELLNRAIALKPTEPFFWRHRDNALFIDPKVPVADALASAEETAAQFPADALAHYELARHYRDAGRIADMERELDRTIAITPIANAVVWKSRIALFVRGDTEEMKTLIERVPSRVRSLERVVFSRWVYAVAVGRVDEGLNALQSLTSNWIEDFDFTGPKALLVAQLLELQGKRELARLQYEAALAEVRGRQARTPGDSTLRTLEVWIMHGLGKDEEARASNRTALETIRRPYRYGKLSDWWFTSIPACLLIGERDTALQLMREAVTPAAGNARINIQVDGGWVGRPAENAAEARAALRLRFKFDPRMARFRDDAEITALLAEPKSETATAPLSEGAQLAARVKAIYTKLTYTRDDLTTAEELARKATDLAPDSATTWGVRAGVSATFLYRNWDLSDLRRQQTQAYANRALGLNPDEVEALVALGHLFSKQGAYAQAEVNFRHALKFDPQSNRIVRALWATISSQGRTEEGRQFLLEAVARDPRDPLVRYDLASSYGGFANPRPSAETVTNILAHLDAGIAVQPLGSLVLMKAAVLGAWRGDLAGMRATLDLLSPADRTEDRAVYFAMWCGLLEHKPDRVAATAALTARTYFEDTFVSRRPKDWSLALAHRQAGKENLARLDWQHAEAVLRARLNDDANNQILSLELATTLAWLERPDEAARLIGPLEAAWREEPNPARVRLLASFYAALGDAASASPYLRGVLDRSAFYSRTVVPLDPWWDKLRGQPEFEALLKELEPKK